MGVFAAGRRLLAGLRNRRPPSCRPAAADDGQHAPGAARRGLFFSRPRRAARRSAGRCAGRDQQPGFRPANPAARRDRGHRPPAHGHGGNRRRHLRLRPRPGTAAGEPGRRNTAGPARRPPPWPFRRSHRHGRLPSGRRQPHARLHHLLRHPWALGTAAHPISRGGPSPSARRHCRPEPTSARGRIEGLAGCRSRARPRAQQFAGSHQVDRRQPGHGAAPRRASARLGS